jgi:hypothetical protein
MNQKNRVRAIYATTALFAIALASGFALAAVFTSTTVTQHANFYQGAGGNANGYSNPELLVSTTPASVLTCTAPPVTAATSGATTKITLSFMTGSSACATGNFAEEFNLSFSATISKQYNNLTITSQVGGGTVQTNTAEIILGAGGVPALFTQTIEVYIDYGAIAPPPTGIDVLDLVVQ